MDMNLNMKNLHSAMVQIARCQIAQIMMKKYVMV